MTINNYLNHSFVLDLQLFAEGGGTGTDGGSTAESGFATTEDGVKNNSLEDVVYGIQEDENKVQTADAQEEQQPSVAESVEDKKSAFEKLIKGEYRDIYNERVKSIVQSRLKGAKAQTDRLESLSPLLDVIAHKYGVDSTDTESLIKAIEDDDAYFEDEAMERGITVKELKNIKKIERENATLKRQVEENTTRENADRLYRSWLEQSEETKKIFPDFDLDTELQNDSFKDLLRAHIDVKTAFQVIHQDEIIGGAMQHAAKTAEKKVAEKIKSNGRRPAENGIASQGAVVVKNDVSKFTDADMDEVIRRVRNGEIIRL